MRDTVHGGVGSAQPHDSAHLHVTGEARYSDDIIEPRGLLYAAVGISRHAHARITRLDLEAVRNAPGVVAVLTPADIPGDNDYSHHGDDPILSADVVQYVGHTMFAVAAGTVQQARRAARLAMIETEALQPVLDLDDAVARKSFVSPVRQVARGEAVRAIASARHQLRGRFRHGGQDHFYLEGHIAMAVPGEDGDMGVYSSTQHPGDVQQQVARALGRPDHAVTVKCRRMGGGFGGKETQPALFACIAALLARKTGRPVKFRVDRDDDMQISGKRHGFNHDYEVGFDDNGRIQGVVFVQAANCGMSADLSGPVADRAIFHSDNAYYLENLHITSYRCKTNTVSNTAFRGFGGPQGLIAIEHVIDEIARYLDKDPLDVRKANYYGIGERDVTQYGMKVEDNILVEITDELERSSDYRARREAIRRFNATSPVLKRGIALTPVKFGISFTATHYNQAGALIHVYTDGSVYLNHGGTEMGQGLFTKVAQVVAEELQVDLDRIKLSAADTSKVPNASATAASSGSDLNGKAAQAAARALRARLTAFAAEHFDVGDNQIVFRNNRVHVGGRVLAFADLVKLAYLARISLSATGYYRTPRIHYDAQTMTGRPFYYFAYGVACSEAVIDTLTGEHKLLRVDILHDVGRSLNPAIDIGQIEGGFVQGVGWLTSEELWWNERGELKTHAPSTYKIPVCSDLPREFNVRIVANVANPENAIHRSKAVGEPPLMLAVSAFQAIKDAVASVADYRASPRLDAPATPEHVLDAVNRLRARVQTGQRRVV